MNGDKHILYVGGLCDEIDNNILHAAFIPFGELKSVELPIDRNTNLGKGYGFIEFEYLEDAEHAIGNMNYSELMGKIIKVNYARTNKLKDGSKAVWGYDKSTASTATAMLPQPKTEKVAPPLLD